MQASFQPVDVIRAMLFAAGVLTAENQCKFRQWFGRRHFILNVKFHSTKCRKSQCRMLCDIERQAVRNWAHHCQVNWHSLKNVQGADAGLWGSSAQLWYTQLPNHI